ncbi:hypothetical protein [Rhodopirellula baltica]
MESEGQIAIERANHVVANTNTSDFQLQSFNSVNALLIGSFDLCYYHEIELEFHEVSYINLPTIGLCSPRFAIAESNIRTAHAYLELDDTDILFEIINDPDFSGQRYYIAAENLTVREGLVYHYQRDELKDGERIAPWVKP